jgi:hypothetical protein
MALLLVRPVSVVTLIAMVACLGWAAGMAAAADKEAAGKAEVGKPAPDIDLAATQIAKTLPDQKEAKTLRLKDLQGKKNVVLYFYPKAMTGG